jgi:hypothetical protein
VKFYNYLFIFLIFAVQFLISAEEPKSPKYISEKHVVEQKPEFNISEIIQDTLHEATKPERHPVTFVETPEGNKSIEKLKKLIQKGFDAKIPNWPNVTLPSAPWKTPLYYAIANANLQKTKLLLFSGANPLFIEEKAGGIPINELVPEGLTKKRKAKLREVLHYVNTKIEELEQQKKKKELKKSKKQTQAPEKPAH